MASNHLKLYPDKTQFVWLGSSQQLDCCRRSARSALRLESGDVDVSLSARLYSRPRHHTRLASDDDAQTQHVYTSSPEASVGTQLVDLGRITHRCSGVRRQSSQLLQRCHVRSFGRRHPAPADSPPCGCAVDLWSSASRTLYTSRRQSVTRCTGCLLLIASSTS
jgi:hypothetical protein